MEDQFFGVSKIDPYTYFTKNKLVAIFGIFRCFSQYNQAHKTIERISALRDSLSQIDTFLNDYHNDKKQYFAFIKKINENDTRIDFKVVFFENSLDTFLNFKFQNEKNSDFFNPGCVSKEHKCKAVFTNPVTGKVDIYREVDFNSKKLFDESN